MFWDVSINTGKNSRFSRHEICVFFLKKKFLKSKQICILYIEKSKKEKKTKIKEMNKGTFTTKKKKNCIEKFETQLEKKHYCTSTGRRHRSYEQGGRQNVNVKV